ncbi:MAG: aspartate aminotransferase family protein, partial [Crocinitomix sp.]|nr:aspartate aminotransferase family protein [Crocinitomix sp.]
KYLHVMVYGEYIQDAQLALAKNLAEILPASLNCSYIVNSGAEANEAALKLAKRVTHRTEIISCKGSYHGSTHGAMSVSANEVKKAAFRPLIPGIKFITFNDLNSLELITNQTAAVIIEPIQGDAGVRIGTQEFHQALRNKCNETGTLLIYDEVQTGFGRTGTFFAFERYGITPDILTLGKALGGGMPIGAFISSTEKMKTLTHNPMLGHITTFGGHPVICAAANACVEVLRTENWISEVNKKGELLENMLTVHPLIHEIRRAGLMFAIEMDSFERVKKVVDYCLTKGLIGFWFLSCPNSFRLSPPLSITEEEIRTAGTLILEAIDFTNN